MKGKRSPFFSLLPLLSILTLLVFSVDDVTAQFNHTRGLPDVTGFKLRVVLENALYTPSEVSAYNISNDNIIGFIGTAILRCSNLDGFVVMECALEQRCLDSPGCQHGVDYDMRFYKLYTNTTNDPGSITCLKPAFNDFRYFYSISQTSIGSGSGSGSGSGAMTIHPIGHPDVVLMLQLTVDINDTLKLEDLSRQFQLETRLNVINESYEYNTWRWANSSWNATLGGSGSGSGLGIVTLIAKRFVAPMTPNRFAVSLFEDNRYAQDLLLLTLPLADPLSFVYPLHIEFSDSIPSISRICRWCNPFVVIPATLNPVLRFDQCVASSTSGPNAYNDGDRVYLVTPASSSSSSSSSTGGVNITEYCRKVPSSPTQVIRPGCVRWVCKLLLDGNPGDSSSPLQSLLSTIPLFDANDIFGHGATVRMGGVSSNFRITRTSMPNPSMKKKRALESSPHVQLVSTLVTDTMEDELVFRTRGVSGVNMDYLSLTNSGLDYVHLQEQYNEEEFYMLLDGIGVGGNGHLPSREDHLISNLVMEGVNQTQGAPVSSMLRPRYTSVSKSTNPSDYCTSNWNRGFGTVLKDDPTSPEYNGGFNSFMAWSNIVELECGLNKLVNVTDYDATTPTPYMTGPVKTAFWLDYGLIFNKWSGDAEVDTYSSSVLYANQCPIDPVNTVSSSYIGIYSAGGGYGPPSPSADPDVCLLDPILLDPSSAPVSVALLFTVGSLPFFSVLVNRPDVQGVRLSCSLDVRPETFVVETFGTGILVRFNASIATTIFKHTFDDSGLFNAALMYMRNVMLITNVIPHISCDATVYGLSVKRGYGQWRSSGKMSATDFVNIHPTNVRFMKDLTITPPVLAITNKFQDLFPVKVTIDLSQICVSGVRCRFVMTVIDNRNLFLQTNLTSFNAFSMYPDHIGCPTMRLSDISCIESKFNNAASNKTAISIECAMHVPLGLAGISLNDGCYMYFAGNYISDAPLSFPLHPVIVDGNTVITSGRSLLADEMGKLELLVPVGVPVEKKTAVIFAGVGYGGMNIPAVDEPSGVELNARYTLLGSASLNPINSTAILFTEKVLGFMGTMGGSNDGSALPVTTLGEHVSNWQSGVVSIDTVDRHVVVQLRVDMFWIGVDPEYYHLTDASYAGISNSINDVEELLQDTPLDPTLPAVMKLRCSFGGIKLYRVCKCAEIDDPVNGGGCHHQDASLSGGVKTANYRHTTSGSFFKLAFNSYFEHFHKNVSAVTPNHFANFTLTKKAHRFVIEGFNINAALDTVEICGVLCVAAHQGSALPENTDGYFFLTKIECVVNFDLSVHFTQYTTCPININGQVPNGDVAVEFGSPISTTTTTTATATTTVTTTSTPTSTSTPTVTQSLTTTAAPTVTSTTTEATASATSTSTATATTTQTQTQTQTQATTTTTTTTTSGPTPTSTATTPPTPTPTSTPSQLIASQNIQASETFVFYIALPFIVAAFLLVYHLLLRTISMSSVDANSEVQKNKFA